MKFLSFILSAAVAFSALTIPVSADNTTADGTGDSNSEEYGYNVIFEDGFDYGDIDALLASGKWGNYEWDNISQAAIESGRLKLTANNNQICAVHSMGNATGKFKFEVDVTPGNAEDNKIVFQDSAWSSTTIVSFNSNKNEDANGYINSINLRCTTTENEEQWQEPPIGSYTPNTPYHVSIVLDTETDSISVEVTTANNEIRMTATGVYYGENIGYIQLAQGEYGQGNGDPVYYDKLVISKYGLLPTPTPTPEPTPTPTPEPTPTPVPTIPVSFGNVICNDPFNYQSSDAVSAAEYYSIWSNGANATVNREIRNDNDNNYLYISPDIPTASSNGVMMRFNRNCVFGSTQESISTGQVGISFSIKPGITNGTNIFALKGTDDKDFNTVNFKNGKLFFGEGEEEKLSENAPLDQWYGVRLSIDFDSGKALKTQVFNSAGELIAEHSTTYDRTDLTTASFVSWSADGQGGIGIDDFYMSLSAPLATPTPMPDINAVMKFRVWEMDSFNYTEEDNLEAHNYKKWPADAVAEIVNLYPESTKPEEKNNKALKVKVNPDSTDQTDLSDMAKQIAQVRTAWENLYESSVIASGKVGITFTVKPVAGRNNLILRTGKNENDAYVDAYGVVFDCDTKKIHIGGFITQQGDDIAGWDDPIGEFEPDNVYSVKILVDMNAADSQDGDKVYVRVNDKDGKAVAYGVHNYTTSALKIESVYASVNSTADATGEMVIDDLRVTSDTQLTPKIVVTPEPIAPIDPRQTYTIIDDDFKDKNSIADMENDGYSFWYPTITKEIKADNGNNYLHFALNYDPSIHGAGSEDRDDDQNAHFIRDLNYQYYAGTTVGISCRVRPGISTTYLALRHDNGDPSGDKWPILFGDGGIYHTLYDPNRENKIGTYDPGEWYTVDLILELKDGKNGNDSTYKWVVTDSSGTSIAEHSGIYAYDTLDTVLVCMASPNYLAEDAGGYMDIDSWYIGVDKHVEFKTESKIVHYKGYGTLYHTRATQVITRVWNTGELNRGNYDSITWNIKGAYIPYDNVESEYDEGYDDVNKHTMHSFTYGKPEDGKVINPSEVVIEEGPVVTLDTNAAVEYNLLIKDFVNGAYVDATNANEIESIYNQKSDFYKENAEGAFSVTLDTPWQNGIKTRRDRHSAYAEREGN